MKPCFALLAAFLATHVLAARPNIVFIIADDMGYSDLGCYGGEIETPHLDGLARKGLRFTSYYVHNMCWPTRASIMTGLYPKTALPAKGSANGGLHPDAYTLPEALRVAGYGAYMAGKWHLSNPAQPDGPSAPHHRGFDRFYGTIHGASDFFAPTGVQLNGRDMEHEWKGNGDYYYTDAKTDYALKFLAEHEKKNDDQPFFLYLAYTAAHWPLHAQPEDIEHYRGRYQMGWDQLRQQRHARMKQLGVVDPEWKLSPRHPNVPAWKDEKNQAWQQRRMEVYAAQITSMDRNIGRVIQHLKETGEFANTLILFQHDNGGCHVEYTTKRTGSWTREFTTDGKRTPIKSGNIPGLMPGPQSTFQSYGYGWANASNTPFRQFKQFDYEGGTRSPLIVSWPQRIGAAQAGGLVRDLCHVIDMMPTLLEVAGVKPPRQKPIAMEGRSFAAVFKGENLGERNPVFWAHAKGRAVRDGDWKLVSESKQPWELYHLQGDGTELNDLSGSERGQFDRLKKLHAEWDQRTNLNRKAPVKEKKKKKDKKK